MKKKGPSGGGGDGAKREDASSDSMDDDDDDNETNMLAKEEEVDLSSLNDSEDDEQEDDNEDTQEPTKNGGGDGGGGGSVECVFCSKRFGSYPSVEEHFQTAHNISPPTRKDQDQGGTSAQGTEDAPNIKCFICPVEFQTFEAAGMHYIFSHKLFHLVQKKKEEKTGSEQPVTKFACGKCGFSSVRQEEVQSHMAREHPPPPVVAPAAAKFKCEQCDFETDTKAGVSSHVAKKHFKAKQADYRCQLCSFTTLLFKNMEGHMKEKHKSDGKQKTPGVAPVVSASPGKQIGSVTPGTSAIKATLIKYKCQLCPYTSLLIEEVKGHMKQEHKSGGSGANKTTDSTNVPMVALPPGDVAATAATTTTTATSSSAISFKCQFCCFISRDIDDAKMHMQMVHKNSSCAIIGTSTNLPKMVPSKEYSQNVLPLPCLKQSGLEGSSSVDNVSSGQSKGFFRPPLTVKTPATLTSTTKRKLPKEIAIYCCQLCNLSVTRRADIRAHMIKEHKELPNLKAGNDADEMGQECPVKVQFDCVECKFTSTDLGELDAHWTTTHVESNEDADDGEEMVAQQQQNRKKKFNMRLVCTVCSSRFYSVQGLKMHMSVAHETRVKVVDVIDVKTAGVEMEAASLPKNSCRLCLDHFESTADLKEHLAQSHKEEMLRVLEGKGTATSVGTIIRAKRLLRMFTCPKCQSMFSTEHLLTRHCTAQHQGERMFPCKTCKRLFTTPEAIRKHMDVHTNPGGFKCPKCASVLKTRVSFRNHILMKHTEGRERSCEICDKKFRWGNALLRHVKEFHAQKTFQCGRCPKIFSSERYLVKHGSTVHDKIRPHLCNICGMGTATRTALVKHMALHERGKHRPRTGKYYQRRLAKTLICPHCPVRFKKETWLKKHTLKKHPESMIL